MVISFKIHHCISTALAFENQKWICEAQSVFVKR